jgi:hypothetical protein
MVRNLRHFIDYDLAGVVKRDGCRIEIPLDGGGNVAEAWFTAGGRSYTVRVESSDYTVEQLGRVLLNDKPMGPIDERTWDAIALEIKADVLRSAKPSRHNRHGFEGDLGRD